MFLEGPTIGFDGFSMVFEILRAIVNDGLVVNNGLHVPSHKKVRGRSKVRVLAEISLIFLSQTDTFNASSSLKKHCNKFMY